MFDIHPHEIWGLKESDAVSSQTSFGIAGWLQKMKGKEAEKKIKHQPCGATIFLPSVQSIASNFDHLFNTLDNYA